ncbi:MAG: hypothetical protein KJO40_13600 [Deltaproteobacteria bacterium]|nr:hypothetical protein [Deltaproteobacteria bacterium]
MGLAELKADCLVHRERILRQNFAKFGDVGKVLQSELAENVWPWLDGLVDALREEVIEEVADLGEAIDELIEREESAIHAELSAMILGVFEAGKMICNETEKLLEATDDELGKKRIAEMLLAYRQGVAIVAERIVEVTLEEGEPKRDDPEGDKIAAEEALAAEGLDEAGQEKAIADEIAGDEIASEIADENADDELDALEAELEAVEK